MTTARPRRTFGELVIRVDDLERMKSFYRDIVGLEVFHDEPPHVFMKVADAVDGHPQLLGLFDRPKAEPGERKIMDHFALLIDLDDYEAEERRLASLGVQTSRREIPYFGWRGLFFADPEGNVVELVCYDESVKE
jgi:catechol-2,3-dioxygenase